jgi:hypothetical protein
MTFFASSFAFSYLQHRVNIAFQQSMGRHRTRIVFTPCGNHSVDQSDFHFNLSPPFGSNQNCRCAKPSPKSARFWS